MIIVINESSIFGSVSSVSPCIYHWCNLLHKMFKSVYTILRQTGENSSRLGRCLLVAIVSRTTGDAKEHPSALWLQKNVIFTYKIFLFSFAVCFKFCSSCTCVSLDALFVTRRFHRVMQCQDDQRSTDFHRTAVTYFVNPQLM